MVSTSTYMLIRSLEYSLISSTFLTQVWNRAVNIFILPPRYLLNSVLLFILITMGESKPLWSQLRTTSFFPAPKQLWLLSDLFFKCKWGNTFLCSLFGIRRKILNLPYINLIVTSLLSHLLPSYLCSLHLWWNPSILWRYHSLSTLQILKSVVVSVLWSPLMLV